MVAVTDSHTSRLPSTTSTSLAAAPPPPSPVSKIRIGGLVRTTEPCRAASEFQTFSHPSPLHSSCKLTWGKKSTADILDKMASLCKPISVPPSLIFILCSLLHFHKMCIEAPPKENFEAVSRQKFTYVQSSYITSR